MNETTTELFVQYREYVAKCGDRDAACTNHGRLSTED
jgi:hypothetical protein